MTAFLLTGLLAAELALQVLVRALRRDFKWLLTEADELPPLEPEALAKFLAGSFDPELGWSRKPGEKGREKGKSGPVVFTIDALGSRVNPAADGQPPALAVIGDSYAFCRQVEDHETWPARLTAETGKAALNYGVGNYGADQALLRYERSKLPATVKTVILAFVPETICRVQSVWKHYLEFGNTFAFKPRFRLAEGRLSLEPCPVRGPADFAGLSNLLPDLRARDRFYASKFRRAQFRFPFVLSILRAPARNARLLALLLARASARLAGLREPAYEDAPFRAVMEGNIREAQALYSDPASRALLRAVLLRFRDEAAKRGHKPAVAVLPQLIDLRLKDGALPCADFYRELGREMTVLDLSAPLAAEPDLGALYVEDFYGGHFSAAGNARVAALVAAGLAKAGLMP